MPIIRIETIAEADITPIRGLTFAQLCAVSPELEIIKQDASRILSALMPRDEYFWQHYESLKRRMKSCVGWNARQGLPNFVRSSAAYDLAFKEIFGRYV